MGTGWVGGWGGVGYRNKAAPGQAVAPGELRRQYAAARGGHALIRGTCHALLSVTAPSHRKSFDPASCRQCDHASRGAVTPTPPPLPPSPSPPGH